jgi:hypothetical protein
LVYMIFNRGNHSKHGGFPVWDWLSLPRWIINRNTRLIYYTHTYIYVIYIFIRNGYIYIIYIYTIQTRHENIESIESIDHPRPGP